jgi:hypothetical protein
VKGPTLLRQPQRLTTALDEPRAQALFKLSHASRQRGLLVRYGGDDLVAMEQRMKGMMPSWHAMDLRLMLSRYQTDGAVASATDLARLTTLLGHAPRSYRAFAKDAASQWAAG